MKNVSMQKLKSVLFLSTLKEMHLLHHTIKLIMPERKQTCVIQTLKDLSIRRIQTNNQYRHLKCIATKVFSSEFMINLNFNSTLQDNAEYPKDKLC